MSSNLLRIVHYSHLSMEAWSNVDIDTRPRDVMYPTETRWEVLLLLWSKSMLCWIALSYSDVIILKSFSKWQFIFLDADKYPSLAQRLCFWFYILFYDSEFLCQCVERALNDFRWSSKGTSIWVSAVITNIGCFARGHLLPASGNFAISMIQRPGCGK